MAITTLPTKTIGSLGPVKTDSRAYLRPTSELPATELEAIKQAIIDVTTEVGLTDATTAGSLRRWDLAFTEVKNADYTAVGDDVVLYDASSGTFILKCPVSPTQGMRVRFKETAGDTTAVTINGNGSNVEKPANGVLASFSFAAQYGLLSYVYTNGTWLLI